MISNELIVLGLFIAIISLLLYISILVYEILNKKEVKILDWLDDKLDKLSKSVF